MKISKQQSKALRKARVRAKISGTATRPRLSVYRSLTALSVQLINDENDTTLFGSDTRKVEGKTRAEKVVALGKAVAEACKKQSIKEVVFDRNGYRYHGSVKSLAEAVRKAGIHI